MSRLISLNRKFVISLKKILLTSNLWMEVYMCILNVSYICEPTVPRYRQMCSHCWGHSHRAHSLVHSPGSSNWEHSDHRFVQ